MFEKFDKNKDGLVSVAHASYRELRCYSPSVSHLRFQLSAEELVLAWSETLKTRITVKEAAALIQQVRRDCCYLIKGSTL